MLERVLTLLNSRECQVLSDFILDLKLYTRKKKRIKKKDYKSFKVTLKNRLINYFYISLFPLLMDSFKNFYFQINNSFIFYALESAFFSTQKENMLNLLLTVF